MKFNVWKFCPDIKNHTGGWCDLTTIKARNEEEAKVFVSREFNTPKWALKVYPHIDAMPEVKL